MRILVVNAGSSSLKVDLVADGERLCAYNGLPDTAPRVDAVGHRIVHGGPDLIDPVVVDDKIERQLRTLVELAPLHQPTSLAALDAARDLLPDVAHVACFDTASHATLPPAAYTYALPRAWRERWGVRRSGFHGLSHAWSARCPPCRDLSPRGRRVTRSCAGRAQRRHHDGFTPLDGLVMATRSGSVDPGLITWLEEYEGLSPREVAHSLEYDSGLLGLAGTADMREVLGRHDHDARLAVDTCGHRLATSIAAMTASLGGLDALVLTGGVGERAARVRALAADRLPHLGVQIDEQLNTHGEPDADISSAAANARTLVIASREDLEIAAGVERLLATRSEI